MHGPQRGRVERSLPERNRKGSDHFSLSFLLCSPVVTSITYFESTLIFSPVRRIGRTPPIFPLTMWNVVGRHFAGTTRTTNSLESFHHALNSLLTCKHPTIWVLLKALHRQQALTNTLSYITLGETKKLVAAQKAWNARIITLVSTYSNADADKTLRGIAFIITWTEYYVCVDLIYFISVKQ